MRITNFAIFMLMLSLASCMKQEDRRELKKPTGEVLDIVMHRGVTVNGIAPANSLDAISLASRIGAVTVEIDIKTTKDGYIVLMHDDELTNEFFRNASDYSELKKPVSCNDITLEELRTNYVLMAKDPAMRRPAPTLEEALRICKLKNLFPMIEIKRGFTLEKIEEAYNQAATILGKGNFSFTSLGSWVVEHLRKIDPELQLSCDPIQNIVILKTLRLNYLPYYKEVIPENVEELHKNGLRTFAWTVPKEEFDLFVDKNIDGILSDDIAPMFKREYATLNDYTDGQFLNYTYNGILKDNVICLSHGQLIELSEDLTNNFYLGGLYFDVEYKGKIKIEANGFTVEREHAGDDFRTLPFQFLFHDEKPFFKITALNDSVQVKSIWLAVNKF